MSTYTKASLVREIAREVGIRQKDVRAMLDSLSTIVCREARKGGGVSVPGICRVDTIMRKPRKMRNPYTGQEILISAHNAARVRLIKSAKEAISPASERTVTTLEEKEEPKPPRSESVGFKVSEKIKSEAAPAETVQSEAVQPDAAKPDTGPEEQVRAPIAPSEVIFDDFSDAVSFRCKECNGEIEAPAAAAGLTSECPVCEKIVTIPKESEPGTIHGPKEPVPQLDDMVEEVAQSVTESLMHRAQKNQTIRIDLSTLALNTKEAKKPTMHFISFICKGCQQELEAPADLMGTSSECPSCGKSFEVPFFSEPGTIHGGSAEKETNKPENLSGRTIRIEMPDF